MAIFYTQNMNNLERSRNNESRKILNNFSQIFCPIDQGAPLRGRQMSEAIIINGGYIRYQGWKDFTCRGRDSQNNDLVDKHTEIIDYTGETSDTWIN